MQPPPPPPHDDLEATVATPRVTPPPPPPGPRRIDAAVVHPVPTAGTVIPPPTTTVVPDPARVAIGNPLVYVLARFFAFALDVALVTVFVTSLAYSLIAINPLTGLPSNTEQGFDATLALGFTIALVYVWIAEALLGTTIFKLAFGLHVYALRDRSVGLVRAFVRNLIRPIDLLVIGGILALVPGHRRLGDLLAGTTVGRSPLRGFAPILGWIIVLVVCGIPFILAGTPRTFASLVAFYEFVPGLLASIVHHVQNLLGLSR
ncbi:MAG: RDD family protein [Candidatus Eremiobacteraeota bacterium]|nr:RDD family protein [Candidatus Eremiobacteraeota bacterium]